MKLFAPFLVATLVVMPHLSAKAQEEVPNAVIIAPSVSDEPIPVGVQPAPDKVQTVPAAPETTDIAAVPPPSAETKPPSPEKEIADQVSLMKPAINVDLIPSLFFSRWEHDLIQDARRGLITRPPESPDDFAAEPIVPSQPVDTGPAPRNVTLAGIVFRSNKDWVIWLNNRRVLPNAIPSEILDLQVHKDYIKLEWFDKDSNQIFPIKLRPHQTFNLDTRIFLPG